MVFVLPSNERHSIRFYCMHIGQIDLSGKLLAVILTPTSKRLLLVHHRDLRFIKLDKMQSLRGRLNTVGDCDATRTYYPHVMPTALTNSTDGPSFLSARTSAGKHYCLLLDFPILFRPLLILTHERAACGPFCVPLSWWSLPSQYPGLPARLTSPSAGGRYLRTVSDHQPRNSTGLISRISHLRERTSLELLQPDPSPVLHHMAPHASHQRC